MATAETRLVKDLGLCDKPLGQIHAFATHDTHIQSRYGCGLFQRPDRRHGGDGREDNPNPNPTNRTTRNKQQQRTVTIDFIVVVHLLIVITSTCNTCLPTDRPTYHPI
jgi:hypothetical protein